VPVPTSSSCLSSLHGLGPLSYLVISVLHLERKAEPTRLVSVSSTAYGGTGRVHMGEEQTGMSPASEEGFLLCVCCEGRGGGTPLVPSLVLRTHIPGREGLE
jgi:hypothetical protein